MDMNPSIGHQSILDWNAWNSLREKYSDFEMNYRIPSDLGKGSIKEFRFKSGLHVYLNDYIAFQPFIILNDETSPSFGFRFCISDHTKLDLACLKESLIVKTGESGAFYFPNMKSCHEIMPGTHTHKILILVDPSFFWSSMEKEETVSAFGQITIPLIKRINFTAGLRYEQVNKELNFRYTATRLDTNQTITTVAYDIEDDWKAFLPKGVLAWDVKDNAMVYASVSKGYLAGGLNTYETEKNRAKFDEQTSIDYEVGAKTQWFDNRLALNIAAFYMDIKDMHVYSMPEPYVFVASNAGEAHSKGIELEARARPLKGLDITAQLGRIDVEYDEYSGYEGNKIQGAPEYTINLAAQYRHASGLFARAEMQDNGETYYNDANTDSQKSFEIYNMKIGYEASHWDLYFYCKNFLDEEYFSYGRSSGIGTLKEVGDPRTFGVVASIHF